MSQPDPQLTTERIRLMFGAGFAFGVMFTMLILATVIATIIERPVDLPTLLVSKVLLPFVTACLFAAVVGIALYLLALPEGGFGLSEVTMFGEREVDRSNPDTE